MVIYGLYALTCQANIDGSGPTRPTEESASDVSCVDKIKNGDESDVDCGGTMCPECKSGRACLTNKDCVSNICKEDTLKCEEIEIDTDKAVEIALSLHREHSKNRDKNSNDKDEGSREPTENDINHIVEGSDISTGLHKSNFTNSTKSEAEDESSDKIVQVEKNVVNNTKQVNNLQSNVDKVLVEIQTDEEKDLAKERRMNETLEKLTKRLKRKGTHPKSKDSNGNSKQHEKSGKEGGFGTEVDDDGESSDQNSRDTESIKEVEETKKFLKQLIKDEKEDKKKEIEALKEMKQKLNTLSRNMNKTSSELKDVRKKSTEKDKALETLGRDRVKEDAIKEIEHQIQTGAKVDYESGALENKDGKKLPSTLKSKIQSLDGKSRKRVEKAREDALRKAADPAIMVTDMTLLLDVTIMLSFAAFGGFLMKVCGLPITFGYIVGGLMVGPSSLEFVSNVAQVQTLAQFGSMFMIFGLGVEYPTEQVQRVRNVSVRGGMLSIIAVALTFAALLSIVNKKDYQSYMGPLLLGCGLAMSSTTVVLAHIRGLRVSQSTSVSTPELTRSGIQNRNSLQANAESLYGQITLGIIAVHEFWMALILSLPELLHSQDLIFSASRMVLGAAVAYMLIKVTPLQHFNRVLYFVATQEESSELFKLGIVSFCLVFSLITYSCGLSLELGAFISGYLLSRSPHRTKALTVVEPLKSLFSIIFFASMGMTLNTNFLITNAHFLLGSAILFIVVKGTVTTLVLYYAFHLPFVTAITIGIVLGSIGELSLVFVSKAAKMSWKGSMSKMISRRHYLLYLATSVVVLLIAPVLHKLLPRQWITLMETKASGDFLRELAKGNKSTDIELATTNKEHGSDND
jgi:Kef-type K+ transport system membrane component KefB